MEKQIMLSGAQKGKIHYLPIRIYYADTDCGGGVHHRRYIEFLERGRTEMLRGFGIEENVPRPLKTAAGGETKEAVILPLVALNLSYKAPAFHNDLVVVETETEKLSGARLYIKQRITAEGRLLVAAECCLALVNASGRPQMLPDRWRALLA